MIRGIHHVAIHSPDIDRTIAFYRDAFGFEPVAPEFSWKDMPELDAPLGMSGSAARTRMLRAGNCYVEVFEYSSPPPRDGEALRPHDYGYTHFAVDVTDIRSEIARLKTLGMTFPDVDPFDTGPIKAIYGKDPDGNIIELQELADDHATAMARLTPAGSR
jgi:catechol 2,3-dioxygenase-like lactoylglutathione lyase family enzyme